jgi:hypothetical protein
MHIKSFATFLNESLSVPVYRGNEDFLNKCLEEAKKKNLIRKLEYSYLRTTGMNKTTDSTENIVFGEWKTFSYKNSLSLLIGTGVGKEWKEPEPEGYFILASSHNSAPMNRLKAIAEEIFPLEATGGSKKNSFVFVRKTLVESRIAGENAIVVKYDVKKTAIEKKNYKEILEMPACKKFLADTGLELISNERALRNNTLTFAYPVSAAIPGDNSGDNWLMQTQDREGRKQPYFLNAIAIFDSGYVRMVGAWNPGYEVRAQVRGKFDPATQDGWNSAFEIATKTWETWKKKWEKEGIELIHDPKEREARRGYITGRKFGF